MTALDSGEAPLESVLEALTREFPGAPFLALGQTVLWDEPLKAAVRLALERTSPETLFMLGVHDTDYFARPHATLSSTDPYVILPHNDGSTQRLWCAAGEISQLFGAETVLTRAELRHAGVRFERVAAARGESLRTVVDQATEAWGWRGITHTSGVETLTHEVPAQDVGPYLLKLLDWAVRGSAETMCHCTGSQAAEDLGHRIRHRLALVLQESADLSDVYRRMLPFMHEILAGPIKGPISISHSVGEARFNRQTASKRRFGIVDLFLQPSSREICLKAYDDAVRGSDIYTLDQFGEGTIPFDLVTPEGGRGTLRILPDGFQIENRFPAFVQTPRRIESVAELADAVERSFGPGVCLVGKAVTWIPIMAADHIFVFHEAASAYTRRTRRMLQNIRAAGIEIPLHPILRVRHHAWDALQDLPGGFCLPEHYAEAFCQREISMRQFSHRWRNVVDDQETLIAQLAAFRKPIDLLHHLVTTLGGSWTDQLEDYSSARNALRLANAEVPVLRRQITEVRHRHYQLGMRLAQLQSEAGTLRKLLVHSGDASVSEKRRSLHDEIKTARSERETLRSRLSNLRKECRNLRSSAEYASAIETVRQIEGQLEVARLNLARRALLVSKSLQQNDRRPSAWWLPLVSPDGSWFRALCESAEAYIEAL